MMSHHHHRVNSLRDREDQYVGPYKLEKTLGKGQTGINLLYIKTYSRIEVAYVWHLVHIYTSLMVHLYYDADVLG